MLWKHRMGVFAVWMDCVHHTRGSDAPPPKFIHFVRMAVMMALIKCHNRLRAVFCPHIARTFPESGQNVC